MAHDDTRDDDAQDESRRRFLKLAAGATAVAVVASTGAFSRRAYAKGLPPLSTADPLAKNLHYTENAAAINDPKHKQGADCANCRFYQGKAAAARGPCQLFPGRSVNAHGWCMSHQPQTS